MNQILEEINQNYNQLNENSIIILHKNLQLLTDKLKNEQNRNLFSNNNNNWIIVSKLLDRIRQHMKLENNLFLTNNSFLLLMTELFRLLRNSCINCANNQRSIITIGSIFDDSIDVFQHIVHFHKTLKSENNNQLVVKQLIQTIKCCLQYFGNLISGHLDDNSSQHLYQIKDKVWKYFAFDLFRELLEFSDDNSVCLITSMIFYNCVSNSHIRHDLIDLTDSNQLLKLLAIIELFLNQISNESSEWSLWSLQLMLKNKYFLHSFYSHLKLKSKLILLDVIYELIHKNSSITETNDSNIVYLCVLFKESIVDIVKIDSKSDNSEENSNNAIHISKLLSVLCELTTNEHYLSQLQSDKQMMELLVDTLKTIQLIGKSDVSSHFISKPTVKQIIETDKEAENPVFGFKRDIIRLIANLVYKKTEMQDWVRELDGIPLILDCCNVDANNPYIMQWSIFAIRNILENNASNQELISSLSRNGVLIDDQLADKLGLQKH